MIYWDSCTLLKLYIPETDSDYFLDLIAATEEQVVTSAITSMELLCAFARKERNGHIKSGGAKAAFEQFMYDTRHGRIIEVPYGQDVVLQARNLLELLKSQKLLIRSLDMIHLASAVSLKAGAIVTTDDRLRQIAILAKQRLLPQGN